MRVSGAHVGLRCDAGPEIGVGHLMRCLALAEELSGRGVRVFVIGKVSSPAWAAEQVAGLGVEVIAAPDRPRDMVDLAHALRLDALVIDSYTVDPLVSHAVRQSGRRVVIVSDDDVRGQWGDVIVDQNLGAERAAAYATVPGRHLLGLDYVMLRDSVRSLRPPNRPVLGPNDEARRVLAFFGGTDAAGAAEVVVPLLLQTAVPMDVTVVARTGETARRLSNLSRRRDQNVTAIPPAPTLAPVIRSSDVVISASGTSTWELLCLGAPAALVWVVDNQLVGYEATKSAGLAVGLGGLTDLATSAVAQAAAVDELRNLCTSAEHRTMLASHGWCAVDGRGRERVADAILDGLVVG